MQHRRFLCLEHQSNRIWQLFFSPAMKLQRSYSFTPLPSVCLAVIPSLQTIRIVPFRPRCSCSFTILTNVQCWSDSFNVRHNLETTKVINRRTKSVMQQHPTPNKQTPNGIKISLGRWSVLLTFLYVIATSVLATNRNFLLEKVVNDRFIYRAIKNPWIAFVDKHCK